MRIDKMLLGESFSVVHKWIDGTFPKHKDTSPYKHWIGTHDEETIRKKWGFGTAYYNSAIIHVIYDYLTHFGIAYLPRTPKEAEEQLDKLGVI